MSNFFVFVYLVVNYVTWPASNSLANCRPVPMFFFVIFPNLNKVEVEVEFLYPLHKWEGESFYLNSVSSEAP